MVRTSANCASYTDQITIFANATAQLGSCSVELPGCMSCQRSDFEHPDEPTRTELLAQAATLMKKQCTFPNGFDASGIVLTNLKSNVVGTPQPDLSADKLAEFGKTSNCFAIGNDSNDSTHVSAARCYPLRPALRVVDGAETTEEVLAYHTQINTSLRNCDISTEAMPQVEEDLKKMAQKHLLDTHGLKIKHHNDLQCSFSHLPAF